MKKHARKQLMIAFIKVVVLSIFMAVFFSIYKFYDIFFASAIDLHGRDEAIIYIPTGSSLDDVCSILLKNAGLKSEKHFRLAAMQKGYINGNIKPGRYLIKDGMSNNQLINMLRSGRQHPVQVVIRPVRTLDELAQHVDKYFEFSVDSLLKVLRNDSIIRSLGFNAQTFIAMFLPNTYEFYWTTTPMGFLERMKKEYDRFWTDERIQKAASVGLTPLEVITLASIVYEETKKKDEMPSVAGVYINRLRRNMKLQADPTVRFAIGDFTINRVLYRHLEYDSPYNTYLYEGLPPGPICTPEIFAIEAVLNYENHDYLYMCARDDFSGYHYFSKTLQEHQNYARRYQQALTKKGIY